MASTELAPERLTGRGILVSARLAVGSPAAIGHRPRRLGLVAWFTLVGATVALLVAGVSARIVEDRLTGHVLDQTVARAVDQVELGILDHVTAEDFAPPFTSERLADLAGRLDPHLARVIRDGSGVLRLHLFANDGTVIYSDLAAKRGQITAPAGSPLLAGALAGHSGTKSSTLTSAENSDLKERHDGALEVYIPFVVGGTVVGAYEIYQDLAPIRPIRPLVWGVILGGFGLLFLSLFLIVRRAAATIQRQQAERESLLRRSEERFRSLIENTSDVIVILDRDAVVRYASPPAERVWGYAPATLEGRCLLDYTHEDDVVAAHDLLAQVAATPESSPSTELRLRHADASWRDFEVIARNLIADVGIGGIILTYHDITERKAFERDLQHLAFNDALTGLPNRALFNDRLAQGLARADRNRRSVAVLFLDLDNFKVVNDSLGHELGDRLLVGVAERLRACLRAEDTAARLGGDEFTVLLENLVDDGQPIEVTQRIAAQLSQPIRLNGRELVPTCSIGIAVSAPGRDRPDTLLRNADLAMYRAKANGKARYAVFDPSMNTDALERLELEGDLRHALELRQLRVVYQPIVTLASGRVSELEALLRWDHPARGVVLPADFIPLAEATGLIVEIGQWVLEEACRRARAWQLAHPADAQLTISVNLSARQFLNPDLIDDIARTLRDTDLAPSCLKLEITESVLMHDTDGTVAKLWALKRLGVRLAIDDFGTGYSSLSYLKLFPVDTLKIDRSFVSGLGQDSNDTAIVRSVVALAKSLNLAVTGEGIETAEQLGHLRALGCDLGQGYLFAKPLAADDVGALLGEPAATVAHVA